MTKYIYALLLAACLFASTSYTAPPPIGGSTAIPLSVARFQKYSTATQLKINAVTNASITTTTVPRLLYFVYGDSTDGGTTPDTTTQASIDALIAAGVPSANIRWLYEIDPPANTFTISDSTIATTSDNVALELVDGSFVIADSTIATTSDNVVITQDGANEFVIADSAIATTSDNVVLSEANVSTPLIPVMTSNSQGGVTLSAATQYIGEPDTYAPFRACDTNPATFYSGVATTLNNKWFQIVFATPKVITQIDTTNIAANGNGYLTATWQYSTDGGTTWLTAAAMTGANNTNLITNMCTHPDAHTHWRLQYVTPNSDALQVQLQEIQVWGY